MVVLHDGSSLIVDKNKQMWLPKSEVEIDDPELVQCGEFFFDVVGFSEKRICYLLEPIRIEGAADEIEDELGNK